jgi:hypothetical protein
MSNVPIGELITTSQHRDAIHVAVTPMVAAQKLQRADHVCMKGGKAYKASKSDNAIGIVDPYLSVTVNKDDTFFVFMYPNTITSLRHEWTHPLFDNCAEEVVPTELSKSKIWIEEFAGGHGLDYDELMDAAVDYVKYGNYLNHGPRFEDEWLEDEFWDHYEVVMNTKVEDDNRGCFFACSC